LEFNLSVTTTAAGDSYNPSLIYGDATINSSYVPEPASCGLAMGLGAATLLARRRRNTSII
jgi:hypothetical protein